MDKAIVFRFYKEPEICLNHLEIVKKHNPGVKVFGLYGWKQEESNTYKTILKDQLDDFYISPYTDSHRKRENWDLVLADWFTQRGNELQWDSVYIVQRDILIFESLSKIFPDYQRNQIYISWTKILDKNTEKKRSWTQETEKRSNYEKFKTLIQEDYGYNKKPLCSLFIFAILPRKFFEKYTALADNTVGFLEYKLPTYAKIFWLDFYRKDIWVRRFQPKGKCPQNARAEEIRTEYILTELKKKKWRRMFHPYFKIRK